MFIHNKGEKTMTSIAPIQKAAVKAMETIKPKSAEVVLDSTILPKLNSVSDDVLHKFVPRSTEYLPANDANIFPNNVNELVKSSLDIFG